MPFSAPARLLPPISVPRSHNEGDTNRQEIQQADEGYEPEVDLGRQPLPSRVRRTGDAELVILVHASVLRVVDATAEVVKAVAVLFWGCGAC